MQIRAQCLEEENKRFLDLFYEFSNVFSWSYKDFCGFYPDTIQHAIPIKEDAKLIRQRQRLVNPALEATIRKELEKLLTTHIIFPVKYLERVANLVYVQNKTCDIFLWVDYCTFIKASVKDNFLLPNTHLILQQVAGSQMISLLNGFSGYK